MLVREDPMLRKAEIEFENWGRKKEAPAQSRVLCRVIRAPYTSNKDAAKKM
jgi:hypothetical protein